MKGQNLFNVPSTTFFAEYDNVQGLNTASGVTINGLQVGKVIDINFHSSPEKRGKLIVEFSVEKDFKFSKNSIVTIYSTSLMGGSGLSITPSYEGETAVPGDVLKGEVELDIISSISQKLNPIQDKIGNVMVRADSLVLALNQVLNKESRKNLQSTIANLNVMASNFKKSSVSLDGMLSENRSKLQSSISNIDKVSEDFSRISSSLAEAELGETIKKLQGTISNLDEMLANVKSGEGSIGKLMNEDGLYTNLENASKELEELLREMKEHPKRFVHFSLFGKKAKEYNPKEE